MQLHMCTVYTTVLCTQPLHLLKPYMPPYAPFLPLYASFRPFLALIDPFWPILPLFCPFLPLFPLFCPFWLSQEAQEVTLSAVIFLNFSQCRLVCLIWLPDKCV